MRGMHAAVRRWTTLGTPDVTPRRADLHGGVPARPP